jgi:hypothetical protein
LLLLLLLLLVLLLLLLLLLVLLLLLLPPLDQVLISGHYYDNLHCQYTGQWGSMLSDPTPSTLSQAVRHDRGCCTGGWARRWGCGTGAHLGGMGPQLEQQQQQQLGCISAAKRFGSLLAWACVHLQLLFNAGQDVMGAPGLLSTTASWIYTHCCCCC